MRRILIVADRTVGGAELRERLALKKSTDPDVTLCVLVLGDSSEAERILAIETAVLRDLQYEVDGVVGASDPLAAIRTVLAARTFDEIILVTPAPTSTSRWLRMDLAHRVRRIAKLPVEEVAGEEADDTETARLAELRFPGTPPDQRAEVPVRVLLVEDDEDDAELTRLALGRCSIPSTVQTVGDGAAAIATLDQAGRPTGFDLVLVDLKMPVMDGFGLLERLRANHDLDQLAVVVLTTSSRLEDRERAHGLGAHAYVTKEASFPLYRDLLDGLLADVTAATR